jgi:NitT/TauT family transport system substrate-binding protein
MKGSRFNRRTMLSVLTGLAALALPEAAGAQALDKVSFQTNWRAQAEHGGFYQALATGIYKKYGIEAEIRMGGPQQDPVALLIAGKVDFVMSGGFQGLNFARENMPFVVVASMMQKDPQVLISHPGVGNDTLAQMKGKPILIGAGGRNSYWPFLRGKFGFTDEQIRPYTFNMAPFLADKNAIQQGYLSSEPFVIQQAGVKPVVHLLADAGFENYTTTITTSQKLIDTKPDLVQRFVNASIEGWISYMTGDPTPGNELIKKDNPDMTDEKIAYAIKVMNEYGIIDSGDSKKLGIGAMTDERWERFYKINVETGVYPADLNFKKAYTLQFINKRVGM